MTTFVRLTDAISVSGQMTPDAIRRAGAQGFRSVINNRPDGEEPRQSSEAELRAAAEGAGLAYAFVPVAGGFPRAAVEAMAAALETPGPVLAFCRSGTRSTHLWALAEALKGGDPEHLVAQAADGGYDISALLPALRSLSEGAAKD